MISVLLQGLLRVLLLNIHSYQSVYNLSHLLLGLFPCQCGQRGHNGGKLTECLLFYLTHKCDDTGGEASENLDCNQVSIPNYT